MSAKHLALPALAAVVVIGYLLWRPSPGTEPAPAVGRAGPAEPRAHDRDDRPIERPRVGDDAPSSPPKTTARDRARSDAMRRMLRARREAAAPASEPAARRPAAHDEPDPAAAAGTLDADYIQSRIREDLLPVAEECYQSALEDDPKLAGTMTLAFTIVGDEEVGGVVDGAELTPDSALTHPGLAECMTESMASLAFAAPEGGGSVSVHYPFQFSSAPAGDAAGPGR